MDEVRNTALQAGGKSEQSGIVFTQQIHVHPGVIVEPLEVAECHQSGEVDIPFLVHHQENEMMCDGASIGRSGPVFAVSRCDIYLAAQNWFDVSFGGLPEKLYSPEHVPMIRDRHGFHTEGGSPVQESVDPNGAVQETVFRVNMQVGEILH